MLDVAPFAISGKLFADLMEQVIAEKKEKTTSANCAAINAALQSTRTSLSEGVSKLKLSTPQNKFLNRLSVRPLLKHH